MTGFDLREAFDLGSMVDGSCLVATSIVNFVELLKLSKPGVEGVMSRRLVELGCRLTMRGRGNRG